MVADRPERVLVVRHGRGQTSDRQESFSARLTWANVAGSIARREEVPERLADLPGSPVGSYTSLGTSPAYTLPVPLDQRPASRPTDLSSPRVPPRLPGWAVEPAILPIARLFEADTPLASRQASAGAAPQARSSSGSCGSGTSASCTATRRKVSAGYTSWAKWCPWSLGAGRRPGRVVTRQKNFWSFL